MKKRKKNFVRQLMISYLTVAVLPLFLFLGVYLGTSIHKERMLVRSELEEETAMVAEQMDALIGTMTMTSLSLVTKDAVKNGAEQLIRAGNVGWMQQSAYAQIEQELCSYALVTSNYKVTFFDDLGYAITSDEYNRRFNYRSRLTEQERLAIPWFLDVQSNYGQGIVTSIQENRLIFSAGVRSFALVRAIRNPGSIIGYLSVEISEADLRYILDHETGHESYLLIEDRSGKVLFCADGFPVESYRSGAHDRNISYVSSASGRYGINVVIASFASDAMRDVMRRSMVPVSAACFLLLITGIEIVIYLRRLTRPINAMREEFSAITIDNLEDVQDTEPFEEYEEIHYAYEQFNEMRVRLNNMIREEVAIQKLYSEERLRYLQAQVNPHFLFNTLNVIGIMGAEHGADQVNEACRRLSSLLQYSISDTQVGTIQTEVENIRDYLNLMKLRYEHRLQYSIAFEPGMEEIEVPRLILEPFIENIFTHGYDAQHRSMQVNVVGYMQEGRWTVIIKDNGCGMNPDALTELTAHIEESRRKLHTGETIRYDYSIGVENTLLRLAAFYGDRFRYEIRNLEEGGFEVIMSA